MTGEIRAVLQFDGKQALDLHIPAGRVTDNVQRLKAEAVQVINEHMQTTGQGAAVQAEDVNLDEEEVSDAEDKPEPEQPKRKKKRAK